MNPTIDVLLQRKSVRAYSDEPLSPETKDLILQATLRAPTAGNMMLYSIITVDDQALKDRLAVTCDHQPFIAKAPWMLLFLADYQRWYDYYLVSGVPELCRRRGSEMRRLGVGDLLLAACDTLIAAHTAVVAAEALGVGSCYIGDILEHYEEHRAMFALPPYALPVCLVCFGYPTKGQIERNQTPRFAREYLVFSDRYRRLGATELEAMMAERNSRLAETGILTDEVQNFGQFNYLRKFSAEFSVEMNRSVRAMIAGWEG